MKKKEEICGFSKLTGLSEQFQKTKVLCFLDPISHVKAGTGKVAVSIIYVSLAGPSSLSRIGHQEITHNHSKTMASMHKV